VKTCKVRERINRLENKPTTDNGNRLRSEGLPEKIILLRQKLNEKARTEPTFKFYALYDRVYRLDVLETAYRLARANKGSAGIDGITFGMIEKDDVDAKKFLTQIHEELKEKRYKASPVKRVYIPKANGKQRPLGKRVFTTKSAKITKAGIAIFFFSSCPSRSSWFILLLKSSQVIID
jgi:hypothetical protein